MKHTLMRDYYTCKCAEFKENSKKLWSQINNTISKEKHKGSIITSITVDGLKQYRPKDIANSFSKFYSELGSNLAKKIVPGTTPVSKYLKKIPQNLNSIVLNPFTTEPLAIFLELETDNLGVIH